MDDGPSQGLGRRLKALFGRRKNGSNLERFEEEIQGLIDHGAEQGLITPNEGEMIQSIVEFRETVAREIMVPRTSIFGLALASSLGEVIEAVLQSGHSRLPVYEKDIDHVVGILHAKDILSLWGQSTEETLPEELVRPPIFVPETKKIVEILAEIRSKKSHMALVLDEYGGTAGLVTLEDIIEEIVGDIHDEYDVEEEPITRVDQDTILVDAQFNIEDLEDFLGVTFPDGDYETVGGFVIDMTGRVPRENDTVEYGGLVFTIRTADERKVSQIEISSPSLAERLDAGLS